MREQRAELLGSRDLEGIDFCREYSRRADEWIRHIATTSGISTKNIALIAVGGFGRSELSPFSDLDLIVLHGGLRSPSNVAEKIFYPIWNDGIRLDHAVRTPRELLNAARADLRVALGFIDARFLWGDEDFANKVLTDMQSRWRGEFSDLWLSELEIQMDERHKQHGDLSDLLEPDLKESHGGLRDINVVRAVHIAHPEIVETGILSSLDAARDVLLRARVALHANADRELDRLLLQEQDEVALSLGTNADLLMTQLSAAARHVAQVCDASWRRFHSSTTPSSRERMYLSENIFVQSEEVDADDEFFTHDLPLKLLQIAALAAENHLPLSLRVVREFASRQLETPSTWSAELRAAFVRLLSSGEGLVRVVESLEYASLFSAILPEWTHVRNFHQRNAYHRFTVDRHLLEAVRYAHDSLDKVSRPDLLVLGTLLHDIGKGLPGDHTEVGIDIVHQLAPRMGLSDNDAAILTQMVRHHLLLADTATRRDLYDPATAQFVSAAVGDGVTLELLQHLSRADGLATGSSAWGPWKAQLVDELVTIVQSGLRPGDSTAEPHAFMPILEMAEREGIAVNLDGDWITVAAADRPRLLSTVAGTLCLFGIDVRSADVHNVGNTALDRFYCEVGLRGWPSPHELRQQLSWGFDHPTELLSRVEQRNISYPTKRRSGHQVHPHVVELPAASHQATVIEVRALDKLGLLFDITRTFAECQVNVVSARLSTVGDIAIDTFYVVTTSGYALTTIEVDHLIGKISPLIQTSL